jgi:hypothetical protein
MTTISFDAVVEDETIRIPARYTKQVQSKVRVLLFPVQQTEDAKSNRIPFYGFDTSGYTFDRDEANAR